MDSMIEPGLEFSNEEFAARLAEFPEKDLDEETEIRFLQRWPNIGSICRMRR